LTVAEVQAKLLGGCWTMVRRENLVRTLVESGSQQLITLAGEDSDVIPEVTLNDIRWVASTL
jgi:hypothetical protein